MKATLVRSSGAKARVFLAPDIRPRGAKVALVRIDCPTCKTVLEDVPDDYPSRPFCSARCKLVDLHAWLNEEYRVSEPLPLDVEDDRRRLN